MTKTEAIAMLKRIQEPEAWEPQINQAAFEALDMAIKALERQPCEDTISRQAAIDALWKALYEYEDKTEKQFQESEDLDVGDWILHRIFVQNMSDIDRQTILNLPSAQPEIIRCKDCKYWKDSDGVYRRGFDAESKCPLNLKKVYEGTFYCGMAERRTDE